MVLRDTQRVTLSPGAAPCGSGMKPWNGGIVNVVFRMSSALN